jgi:hypothetical protein
MTFDEAAKLLEARGRVNYTDSKSITACCPAHNDTRPSFSMAEKNGKLLLYCFAGCSYQSILEALKQEPKARAVRPQAEAPKPIANVQRWPICDVAGKHIATLVRLNHPDGAKTPFWTMPDGTKGLGGMRVEDLPLYGSHLLPIYDEATYDGPIYLCEGPKDADALIDKGIPALGTVTGAHTIPSDDSLRVLVGRKVILWPDNDEAGRKHMQRIAERLTFLAQNSTRRENRS